MCELFAISSRYPATVSLSLKTLAERGGGSAPHSAMSTSESRLVMPMLGSGASGVGRSRGTSPIGAHKGYRVRVTPPLRHQFDVNRFYPKTPLS